VFIDRLKVINTLSERNVEFFFEFAHGAVNGVIPEESSIYSEVMVSTIVIKNVNMNTWFILDCYQDTRVLNIQV
jgi:hypothetical protein